ncbi:MAG: hypothetical protein ACI9FO_000838 [Methylophagaceae bacterium]|jgi:hypothetical protein
MEFKIEAMSLDLTDIELIAAQILQQLHSGEIHNGCSMSAVSSPVTEAWDRANELAEKVNISPAKKKNLINRLDLYYTNTN